MSNKLCDPRCLTYACDDYEKLFKPKERFKTAIMLLVTLSRKSQNVFNVWISYLWNENSLLCARWWDPSKTSNLNKWKLIFFYNFYKRCAIWQLFLTLTFHVFFVAACREMKFFSDNILLSASQKFGILISNLFTLDAIETDMDQLQMDLHIFSVVQYSSSSHSIQETWSIILGFLIRQCLPELDWFAFLTGFRHCQPNRHSRWHFIVHSLPQIDRSF